MKSINQIFKNNKHLLEYEEVQNLIKYTEELEDEIVESNNSKIYSKEELLIELVTEIKSSIDSFLDDEKEYEKLKERYPEFEKPDFREGMINLKKYLNEWSKNNRFFFD